MATESLSGVIFVFKSEVPTVVGTDENIMFC